MSSPFASLRAPGYDVGKLRREEFSWMDAERCVYLNAASTGPIPERSMRAVEAFSRKRAAPHKLSFEEQFGVLDVCRSRVAELIGATGDEIALAGNTSAGINLAAWGLPLGAGDVVVVSDGEFPANMYPWLGAAEARGYRVHRVACGEGGLMDEDALLAALELPGVRVLSVSWVGFVTGVVANLDRLGAECRARGVWLVVDAIQGLGALTLDVAKTPVDLVACGAQKWLLSPWGTGFTYVRRSLMEVIVPQPVSWVAVRGADDFSRLLEYDLTYRDSARRYEQVTLPFQDFAGMAESLGLLLELGAERVSAHIRECARVLMDGFESIGVEIVTPRERHAGIVSLRPEDVMALSHRMEQGNVVHSVREGTVRVSPHAYSNDVDVRVSDWGATRG